MMNCMAGFWLQDISLTPPPLFAAELWKKGEVQLAKKKKVCS